MERYRQHLEKSLVDSRWINSSHPGIQMGNKYADPWTLLGIIKRLFLMPRSQEGSIPEVSILKRIKAPLSFPASSGDARSRNLEAFCQFIRGWADQAADD
jgi:hypothetical protein